MDKIIKISLDLTDCKYIRDFHERIRVALDFPEWYGANLDALWDLLSEPCFMEVSVVGADTMSKELREYFPKIIKVFEDVKITQKKYGCSFEYKILR
jgi:RNAse (barnase) inhibitor barstar